MTREQPVSAKFKIAAMACAFITLAACAQKKQLVPSQAEMESAGLQALHGQQATAMQALTVWAHKGHPVAQRELAFAYAATASTHSEALHWLEQAASAGDSEAQFQLAETYYKSQLGVPQDYRRAWAWYEDAGKHGNPKASLMLARMAKYGEGRVKDVTQSAGWLIIAARQGNAQAMFLLSNAYAAGEGLAADQIQARQWLERAADGDYPVAIQALAMELDGNTLHPEQDPTRARHLLKEASDERLLRWNKYQ